MTTNNTEPEIVVQEDDLVSQLARRNGANRRAVRTPYERRPSCFLDTYITNVALYEIEERSMFADDSFWDENGDPIGWMKDSLDGK